MTNEIWWFCEFLEQLLYNFLMIRWHCVFQVKEKTIYDLSWQINRFMTFCINNLFNSLIAWRRRRNLYILMFNHSIIFFQRSATKFLSISRKLWLNDGYGIMEFWHIWDSLIMLQSLENKNRTWILIEKCHISNDLCALFMFKYRCEI